MSEDLSKGTIVSFEPNEATATANRILTADANARRWHRHAATAAAVSVITALLSAMFIVINTLMCALVNHRIAKIAAEEVAIVSVLVIGATVLSIAFIKAAFASSGDRKSNQSEDKEPQFVIPAVEAIKATTEAIASIFKKGG